MQKKAYHPPLFGALATILLMGCSTLFAQIPPSAIPPKTGDEDKRPATISPGLPLPIVFAQSSPSGQTLVIAGQIQNHFPGYPFSNGQNLQSVFRLRLNAESVHFYDLRHGRVVEPTVTANLKRLEEKTPVLFFYGTEPPDESLDKLQVFNGHTVIVLHVPLNDEEREKMNARIEYLPSAKMPTPPSMLVPQLDEETGEVFATNTIVKMIPETKTMNYTVSYEIDGQTRHEQRTRQYTVMQTAYETMRIGIPPEESMKNTLFKPMTYPPSYLLFSGDGQPIDESYVGVFNRFAPVPVLENDVIRVLPPPKPPARISPGDPLPIAFVQMDATGQNLIITGQIQGNFPRHGWPHSQENPEPNIGAESGFRLSINKNEVRFSDPRAKVRFFDLQGKEVGEKEAQNRLKHRSTVLFFYGTRRPDRSVSKFNLFRNDTLVLHVPEMEFEEIEKRLQHNSEELPTPPMICELQTETEGSIFYHKTKSLPVMFTKETVYEVSREVGGQTFVETRTKTTNYTALKRVSETLQIPHVSFDEKFAAERPSIVLSSPDDEPIDESYRQILRDDAPVLRNDIVKSVSRASATQRSGSMMED